MKLAFKNLADFEPDAIVNAVPELRKLVELRAALTALKHPLGSVPAFRKKLQALLGDDAARQKLTSELGLAEKPENK
jgi:type VI secretion system protein ImpB